MTTSCTTCGQSLVDHDVADSDDNNVVATRPLLSRLLPILLIGAALLGAAAWFLWNQKDDTLSDEEASELLEDEPREVSLGAVETREVTATIDLAGVVSYLSNEGLVLLNFASGEATIFGAQVEPLGFTGRLLLASGDEKTYRVDTSNPQALSTLSAYGEAVPTDISRIVHLAFEPSNSPGRLSATIMSLDGGLIGDAVPVPVGSKLEAIDHFGMVLHSPTGGTYEFTRDGLELLSPNRVVAVAGDSRVEVQCDEELVCSHYLVDESREDGAGGTRLEDLSARSTVSLSPDGSHLLSFHDGALEGLRTDTFSAIPLDLNEADGKAAWARDSSRFAWLSRDGRVLSVAQSDGTEVARLDLRALGLPAASGSSVVLSG